MHALVELVAVPAGQHDLWHFCRRAVPPTAARRTSFSVRNCLTLLGVMSMNSVGTFSVDFFSSCTHGRSPRCGSARPRTRLHCCEVRLRDETYPDSMDSPIVSWMPVSPTLRTPRREHNDPTACSRSRLQKQPATIAPESRRRFFYNVFRRANSARFTRAAAAGPRRGGSSGLAARQLAGLCASARLSVPCPHQGRHSRSIRTKLVDCPVVDSSPARRDVLYTGHS